MLSAIALGLSALLPPLQEPAPRESTPPEGPVWRSIEEATVEGRAWSDLASPFDRLPARAEGLVRPPVWMLQRASAGVCARFVTNAKEIQVRWTLTSEQLAMPHMPATGVSGVDLYGRDETGQWRWVGNGRPAWPRSESRIAAGLDGKMREYLLYLPLYNGVSSVEVGLPADARFAAGPARPADRAKPVVFYGTSITQGACASRPGMAHAAILGRRLDRPVVNLGFSGNGRMDLELAPMIAEIDAALYVIDCLPNMSAEQVRERAAPFVRALRAQRPDTPILLVEDRTFTNAPFKRSHVQAHARRRAALRDAMEALRSEDVERIAYLPGDGLLGLDGDAAVDASHPTDLGFERQADAFEPVVRELLGQPRPLRILLLGDSISLGYTAEVRRRLAGRAIVARANCGPHDRRHENCAGTTKGVAQLDRWLAQDGGQWDVIHFNFGLHDLKRVDGATGQNSNDPSDPRQAEPDRYRANLTDIAGRLKATGATVIFATTTPVPEGELRPHRDPADAPRYNAIAREVMAKHGVLVNDLFEVIASGPASLGKPANVHFTREGSAALGAAVAAFVLEAAESERR